jgi:cbb3-type cytochrome oxidase cytochrome c subunit
MKGLAPLFLGIFGTFAFSWVGLTVIPNLQIGYLDPQSDEEGTDIYPMPQSGMVERGRRVYAANGCIYCHSQQLRADYISSDVDRDRDYDQHPKWGQRRSAPRDYIFDRPVLLGKERMGPDLANIGKAVPAAENGPPAASPAPAGSPASSPTGSPAPASKTAAVPSPAVSPAPTSAGSPAPGAVAAAPSASPSSSPSPATSTPGEPPAYAAAWHHRHLYSPRSVSIDSNMPAYHFLYKKRHIGGERSADALELTGSDAPPAGWEIVPTFDAQCLVAYLMSLDQSHPLAEVKSAAPATSSGAAAAPAAGATSPAPASAKPK